VSELTPQRVRHPRLNVRSGTARPPIAALRQSWRLSVRPIALVIAIAAVECGDHLVVHRLVELVVGHLRHLDHGQQFHDGERNPDTAPAGERVKNPAGGGERDPEGPPAIEGTGGPRGDQASVRFLAITLAATTAVPLDEVIVDRR